MNREYLWFRGVAEGIFPFRIGYELHGVVSGGEDYHSSEFHPGSL